MGVEDDTPHIPQLETDDQNIADLTVHLLKQKVIEKWELKKPIGSGANGVVFLVTHSEHKQLSAVLKIAINGGASCSLFWECNVMKKLVDENNNEDRTQHLARILDHGVTTNHLGENVGFVVMECLPDNPTGIVFGMQGEEMFKKVCDMALQMLKAIYDMHYCGFIHRDLKPENMGLYKNSMSVVYDMGMVRVITDKEGNLRDPRTYVGLRGTDEWASLNAELGFDQSRVDDLWGWFYTVVELVNCHSKHQQAWAIYDRVTQIRHIMKSDMFAAQYVLANCPSQFHKIQCYLRCLGHTDTPNYFYIASLLNEARKGTKRKKGINVKPEMFKAETEFLEKQFF